MHFNAFNVLDFVWFYFLDEDNIEVLEDFGK